MNFLSFSQIVTNTQIAISNLLGGLVDFGLGKPLGALVNAVAQGYTNLQGLLSQVLSNFYLQTCDDASADTFFAQFNFTRLPAVQATGHVTFSQYYSTAAALIPLGTIVKTADGSLSFTVTEDATNPLWNAGMSGYLVPAGTLSATVPIQAVVAGSASNVQAGTISLISGSTVFSSVTNAVGLTNGVDEETTQAATVRFWKYLNTRSQATQAAVEFAIESVQSNLTYSIVENPVTRAGFFQAFVDDGSGSPSATLLSRVSTAIDAVRPLTVTYQVLPPTVVQAEISLTIYPAFGYQKSDLIGPVAQALTAWVNGLGVGVPLRYFDLATVARNVEGVAYIENLSLNNATNDIGGGVSDSVHINQTPVVN